MKNLIIVSLFFINVASARAFEFKALDKKVGSVSIPFVQNMSEEEVDYTKKADYSLIEKIAPLKASQLAALHGKDFRSLTMEEFNQIYARLSSGPMPLGDYDGFILQKPPVFNAIKKRIVNKITAVAELMKLTKLACAREPEDCLLEFFWRGKRFGSKNDMDQIKAQSRVLSPVGLHVFPMNTFCGISQVDTRRESIIVDGAYGDDFKFPDYIGVRDEIITRKGLNISEEYRMVRPGLYIGKVYSNKLFLFNVALESTSAKPLLETKNECADGSKTR